MKQVGLLFGSFNPIHLGHLAIADFFIGKNNLSEIWLVVSPQSPFKTNEGLIEKHHRLAMVELALNNNQQLKACAEEFKLPTPNYTIDTLNHLKEKYPQNQFSLILGQDNMVHFDRWKSCEQILEQHQILVYPRSNANPPSSELLVHPNITYCAASLLEISATDIRTMLKQGKVNSKWLPAGVDTYLNKIINRE